MQWLCLEKDARRPFPASPSTARDPPQTGLLVCRRSSRGGVCDLQRSSVQTTITAAPAKATATEGC